MDPLSDVLSLLNTRNSFFAGLRAGGDWAMKFPPPEGIKFNAIVDGSCWLTVEGVDASARLQAGDCFLLSEGRSFTLASDLSLDPIDALEVYRVTHNGVASYGDLQDFFLIGGRFAFCEEAKLLLDSLPPVAIVHSDSEQAPVLQWALQRLAHELSGTSPGGSLMTQYLGHMMLIQVLRLYLASKEDHPAGWLFALSDPRVNATIEAIHREPARRWTVGDLATVAGVSRSTFALHFKKKVGLGPLEYVSRWRMQLAARELRNSDCTISSIAQSLGYDSDSAFSNAFKRIMAHSPREYRERSSAA
jgi:AraC-like DNA-binding protein